VDPALIEDAILGCGYPEGRTGRNLARASALRAGLPLSIAGATVSRFCASGLQAIAMAASRIIVDGAPAMIAGGVESISGLRRNGRHRAWTTASTPGSWNTSPICTWP
jgi:acetyl-CoA C-acetyltransferase